MRRYKGILFLVSCLLWLAACQDDRLPEVSGTEEPGSPAVAGGIRKGVLQIKFSQELNEQPQMRTRAAGKAATGNARIDDVLADLGQVRMERIFPYAGKFEERHRQAGLDRWYRLMFDENIDPHQLEQRCAPLEGVEKAGPEYEIRLAGEGIVTHGHVSRALYMPVTKTETVMPFNDPQLSMQWHYDHGDLPMAEGAGIGLFKAWRVTTGDPRVVVAVLDMGVDYAHEDLAANMWVNEAELNGLPGVDDDNNGYVDDIYGYNFAAGTGNIKPGDHGTHIAGTVAAVNGNGVGVCGVAGGSGNDDGVRIMSCQLGEGSTELKNPEAAMVYAADNGASIIQCSWYLQHTQALQEAVDYFIEHAASPLMSGGLAVFAAGNEGVTSRRYPAAYSNTVSVASVNQNNRRSSFSNYGDWIDISAPGGIGSNSGSRACGILSTLPGNDYGYMNGTSMAAPHVSGVAALVISARGGAGFTAGQLKEILYTTVGALNSDEPNKDLMGRGVLRADRALWNDDGVAPAAVTDLQLLREKNGGMLNWTVAADANDGQAREYVVYYRTSAPADGQGTRTAVWPVKGMIAGDVMSCPLPEFPENATWHLAVAGRDVWGNESPLSNEVTVVWNNDHRAPDIVSGVKFEQEGKRLYLSWVNPADAQDGTAVLYRIVVRNGRAEDSPVVMDRSVVVSGKAGDRTRMLIDLPEMDENYMFSIAAIDCWNNSSDFSEAVYYLPVAPGELKVYPNPVSKELFLNWGEDFTGTKSVRIYDQAGRLVMNRDLSATVGADKDVIDLSALAAGSYVLKFSAGRKQESRNIMKIK